MTHGIISARERGQISLGGNIRIKDFLQTDAAINPGSSGGPLINLDGEVVGINTAIASQNNSNSGVAFGIPVNLVRKVARQLLEKGAVTRGFLGLHLASAFEPADALKLGLESANGALVDAVYPETPAAAAGLKPGDVILQMDETPIPCQDPDVPGKIPVTIAVCDKNTCLPPKKVMVDVVVTVSDAAPVKVDPKYEKEIR